MFGPRQKFPEVVRFKVRSIRALLQASPAFSWVLVRFEVCDNFGMPVHPTLYLAPLTYEISVAFHDVVHELGTGFGEAVCQKALAIVLRDKGLLAETSYPFTVSFRDREIGTFEADIVVERLVIVEVKATTRVEDWAKAQLMNYLKCAGGGVGILANFGSRPECRRFVMGHPTISLPTLDKEPARQLGRWLRRESQPTNAQGCHGSTRSNTVEPDS